ncbi:hypothetical protein ATM97_23650 [Nocardia sp. MH4]|uniref:hypothetical protein n=1 Tax=Nocardia sp. MH4 TaxID=1768677 RepID=UPI001C4E970B|nr:hypothetical protein [Nocardia sp. MH4]MBW0273083.1 hypothetical protein [Nocardia sp. MH4]
MAETGVQMRSGIYGRGSMGLVDRFTGFDYGYRMLCECEALVTLSAQQYWEQSHGSLWCEGCQDDVNFGPYTVQLRDPDDPLLSDEAVARHAWYHTSKYRDWPAAEEFLEERAKLFAEHPMRGSVDLEEIAELGSSKALHVGTYETAIENMLRRMRDQTEVGVPFYLHRVGLELGPGDLNEGYLDENNDGVSQVAVSKLRDQGLRALRYLNVRESMGSLSLALDPAAIASVQTIALPVHALAPVADPSHLRLMHEFDQVENENRAKSASGLEAGFRALFGDDYEQLRQARTSRAAARYRPSPDSTSLLETSFLDGVGQPVCEDFSDALSHWHSAEDADTASFYEQFRALSAVLTREEEVVAVLKAQPLRRLV